MVVLVLRSFASESEPRHCDHCLGARATCSCSAGCARGDLSYCQDRHSVPCFVCRRPFIIGTRFVCQICEDVSLCTQCKDSHDATHSDATPESIGQQQQSSASAPPESPEAESSPGGACASHMTSRQAASDVKLSPSTSTSDSALNLAHICDGCGKRMESLFFRCTSCEDFDLCKECYRNNVHDMDHAFRFIVSIIPEVPSFQTLHPRSHTVKGSIDEAVPSEAHCTHCPGWLGNCCCTECPRPSPVKCIPASVFSSCSGCMQGDHDFIDCDVYQCESCSNVSLCTSCYEMGVHDTSHPFVCRRPPEYSSEVLRPRDSGGDQVACLDVLPRELPSSRDTFVCSACEGTHQSPRFNCTTCSASENGQGTMGSAGETNSNTTNLCTLCYYSGKHQFSPEHDFELFQVSLGIVTKSPAPPRDFSGEFAQQNSKLERHQVSSSDSMIAGRDLPGQSSSCASHEDFDEAPKHLAFSKADISEESTQHDHILEHEEKTSLEEASQEYAAMSSFINNDSFLDKETLSHDQIFNDKNSVSAPENEVGEEGEYDTITGLLLARMRQVEVAASASPRIPPEPTDGDAISEDFSSDQNNIFPKIPEGSCVANEAIRVVDTMPPYSKMNCRPGEQCEPQASKDTAVDSGYPSTLDYMESMDIECAEGFISELQKAKTSPPRDAEILPELLQPPSAPLISPKVSPKPPEGLTPPLPSTSPGPSLQSVPSNTSVSIVEISEPSPPLPPPLSPPPPPDSFGTPHIITLTSSSASETAGGSEKVKTGPYKSNVISKKTTPPPPPPPEYEDDAHHLYDLIPSAPSLPSSVFPSGSLSASRLPSEPRLVPMPPPPPPEDFEDFSTSEDLTPSAPPALLEGQSSSTAFVGPPPPPPPPQPVEEDAHSHFEATLHTPSSSAPEYQSHPQDHLQNQQQLPNAQYPPQQHPYQQYYLQQQNQQQNPYQYQYQYQYQYPGSEYGNVPAYTMQGGTTVYPGQKPNAVQKASDVAQQAMKEASLAISSLMKKAKR